MAGRTLTISSAGKTFSFTGWKVGWATGPSSLIAGVQRAHQFLTFCAATPLHVAMAAALDALDDEFVGGLQRDYLARRDFVVAVLREVGFNVAVPEGAYFCLARFGDLSSSGDKAFARRLIEEAGVAAIPPSAFYVNDVDEGAQLLRFAFCKKRETLDEAARRLRDWRAREAR
jgi:N-succinyldiaminopimelate aminotransferase